MGLGDERPASTEPNAPKSASDDADWNQHRVRAGPHHWGGQRPPADPGEHRKRIEPWLAALLQAEHVSLVVGGGLTFDSTVMPYPPPIRIDAGGIPRVGGSRVSLASIVFLHQQGATPEQIQERFPSVALSDVCAAIAYYLRHRAEVDAHLAELEAEAEGIQDEVDARPETRALREKLLTADNRPAPAGPNRAPTLR